MHLRPTAAVDKLLHEVNGTVDPVLGTHDPEVRQQGCSRRFEAGGRIDRPHRTGVRTGADDGDALRRQVAAGHRDAAVAAVSGDDMVGRPVGLPLQPAQATVLGAAPGRVGAAETREEEFRVEVVLVEHELHTARPPEAREQPVGVRGVAGLDDIEPALASHRQRQGGGAQPGVQKLPAEAEGTSRLFRGAVLVEGDAVDHLVRGVPRAFGADHGDLVPLGGERLTLQPHAAVERHGQVLDNDQHAAGSGQLLLHDGRPPFGLGFRPLVHPLVRPAWGRWDPSTKVSIAR